MPTFFKQLPYAFDMSSTQTVLNRPSLHGNSFVSAYKSNLAINPHTCMAAWVLPDHLLFSPARHKVLQVTANNLLSKLMEGCWLLGNAYCMA